MRQRRFVGGGSVSIWTFSQKTFLFVVSRCTLLIVRQSGKRLSRRRAMRRRKRASLDVHAFRARGNVGEICPNAVARGVCAPSPRRRVSAAPSRSKQPRVFAGRWGGKRRWGFLPAMALTRRRGKSAHTRLAKHWDILCRRSCVLGMRRTSSDARLRHLLAHWREGRLPDCLTVKRVYRHTPRKEPTYILYGISQ